MKQIFVLLLLACAIRCFAQNPLPYFQQEVNYRINATLDDTQNILTGNVAFEYINHSPDALPQIWVHLWGNAFKNHQSAFCKQKLRDGNSRFYFAKDLDLGFYKQLDFTANGQKAAWKFDPKNPDIAVITLLQPLAPGARVRIETPFSLKIPASFSRLGHVETSYQMTQWYPKPAVYDHKGWHAMPYLDMGEFYSDFGSFDVTLTLPENYVVGATGVLMTASEIEFLQKKETETRARLGSSELHQADPFPASSPKMKTIRYTAEKVHDFAWFADKRFLVLKDTARLASGKTVDCWAMFPSDKETALKAGQSKHWEKGAFYVRRAIEFYSDKVGEYPWPQATAVHSALSAGGGMEYPMITVIGNSSAAKDLDNVITHEVGHNWFYGILASNERDHPFMDEGLNSYYENRYMKEYYKDNSFMNIPKFILNEKKQGSLFENGYLILAREHQDTPPDTHSNAFSQIAYGLQVYMKTAICLHWLEQAEGTKTMDSAMQEYYQRWQFRHPYPEDLKAVFQEKELKADWFFESMQTQKQLDLKLKGFQNKEVGFVVMDRSQNGVVTTTPKTVQTKALVIQNKGQLSAPFSITALKDGKPLKTEWFPPIEGRSTKTILFHADSADAYEIDHVRKTLDLNRKDNFRRTTGLFPGMRPLEFRSIAIFQNSRRNTIAALPWVGWNNADKTILGLVIYNPPLPSRKLQYYLLPGFASGSKRLVGLADVKYKFFPGGLFPKVTLGVGIKSFDFNFIEDQSYTRFYRIAPQVQVALRSPSMSFTHVLSFRTLFIGRQQGQFGSDGQYLGNAWKNNTIHELRYEGEAVGLPHPYRFQIALETQSDLDASSNADNYLRGTMEWQQKIFYKEKKKITLRAFGGYFLHNPARNENVASNALSLNTQDFNDYKLDQPILARSGGEGFRDRQVTQNEGGFKGAFGSAVAGSIGNSNNYILALNLKADLPVRLPLNIPLRPYFDLGYYDDASNTARPFKEQLLWSGGLMLEFFKGGLEFYFPLVNSSYLNQQYCKQAGGTRKSGIFCGENYMRTISWSVRLRFSDPVKQIENFVR
jgi:hypothetical protein